MTGGRGDVKCLEAEVAAQVHGASRIRSFCHAVIEVVSNAVDAGASRIDVSCDFNRHSFVVEDNGCGMRPEDVTKIGAGACTSNLSRNKAFLGFRGDALHALSNIAHVMIATKAPGEKQTSSVEFWNGSRRVPPTLVRKEHGTTVWVSKFLNNFPVRQRISSDMG